jgi:hypothetical protein
VDFPILGFDDYFRIDCPILGYKFNLLLGFPNQYFDADFVIDKQIPGFENYFPIPILDFEIGFPILLFDFDYSILNFDFKYSREGDYFLV